MYCGGSTVYASPSAIILIIAFLPTSLSPSSFPILSQPTHPHYPPSPHPPTLTTHPHYTHPQAIYNRGNSVMSVDRLLELLKQFKDSTNKRERVWLARFCTTVDFVLPCHYKQPDVEVAFSLIPRPTPARKRFWNFSRDFLAFSESLVLKTLLQSLNYQLTFQLISMSHPTYCLVHCMLESEQACVPVNVRVQQLQIVKKVFESHQTPLRVGSGNETTCSKQNQYQLHSLWLCRVSIPFFLLCVRICLCVC